MLFLCLTAWVVASTALEEDDYCERNPYNLCYPGEGSKKFPETKKEFDKSCPIILEHFRCMQEHASKCDSSMLEAHTAYVEVLQDLCRKDSRLHEAIAKNAGCIKQSVTEECSEKIFTLVRAYEVSRNVTEDEDWIKLTCMSEAYALTCASDAASEPCGTAVKAAILESAYRADYLGRKGKCPRNVRQELVKDIPAMEISTAQKLLLEEILLET